MAKMERILALFLAAGGVLICAVSARAEGLPAVKEVLRKAKSSAKGMPSIAAKTKSGPQAPAEPPYGEVVFLWGRLHKDLSEQIKWADMEKTRFEPIAQRLKRGGFGVRYVTMGTAEELRQAAQNPKTTVIIWSGMAAEEGMSAPDGEWQTEKKWDKGDLLDVNGSPVPYDAFDKTPGLRQIVLGSSYGDLAEKRYAHSGAQMLYFTGDITMTDLFDFLENGWDAYLKRDFFGLELKPAEEPRTAEESFRTTQFEPQNGRQAGTEGKKEK